MKNLYRNEITRRIAAIVLSFVVMATFMPSFALQNVYAEDEEQVTEEVTVQDEEAEPEAEAEEVQDEELNLEEVEEELPVFSNAILKANSQSSYTTQPENVKVGVSDEYHATCTVDFDVTDHISVEQYVQNRVTKELGWVEKVGSEQNYKAGDTITMPLLRATDKYGNRSTEPSTQIYRFVIQKNGENYVSREFTITWAYPIIKTQVSEIDYPINGKKVDTDVVITSTYLDGNGKEQKTTEGATATRVEWFEFSLLGTEGTSFSGTYSLGHTYSVNVDVKANNNYFFPEGDAYTGENSNYNKYEHNGESCSAVVLGMDVQFAGVSNEEMALHIETNTSKGDRIVPLLKDEKKVYRIAGSNRYQTSLKIADEQKLSIGKFNSVVLAYGDNYPDALAGSFLAIANDAPIILIKNEKTVRNNVYNYLSENLKSGGKIYILGGTSAIPASIEKNLKNKGYDVYRIGGSNRYDTNIKILESAAMSGKPVIISSGTSYADSLSSSSTGYPIMIVDPVNGISDTQIAFLKSKGSNKFYVIGGDKAVPTSVDEELSKLGSVERLAGENRYETSQLVAEEFSDDGRITNVVIAYGKNFPDGLCAGPLAADKNASLVLTENSRISIAKEYVDNHVIIHGYVTGGTALISDDSALKIMNADTVVNK